MKGADLKLRINQAIILLLSILSCGQCQVTTSISQVTLRLLPDTYTEINLISQDVTNEIKQDTTDITVSFNLTNNTAFYSRGHAPVAINVIPIGSRSNYECYMTLINWRVPVRSVANLDTFFQQYNSSMGCGGFANMVSSQGIIYQYFNQRDDLFTQPLDVNISNMMVIVDNTVQLSNLKAFIQSGSSSNALPVTSTQYLKYDIDVAYKLSDRWFIMTVTFGCLDGLALATAVALLVQFKRSKQKHGEFRRRREKWFNIDQDYVKDGGIGDKLLNEYGQDPLGQQLLVEDARNTDFNEQQLQGQQSSPTEYGLRMLSPSTNLNPTIDGITDQSPFDINNRLNADDGGSRHQPPGYQASFQASRKTGTHNFGTDGRANSSVMIKSASNITNGSQPNQEIVMNMESEDQAEQFDGVGGLPQSQNKNLFARPQSRVSKQNSDSLIGRESGLIPGVKYKAAKKRSNLFD